MSWSDLYLICFLVGFSLSVLSFLAGAIHIHLPFRMHFPFQGAHRGAGIHAHAHGPHGSSHGGVHMSWFNASTAMAFLAWFGGIGYIVSARSHLASVVALAFAVLGGLGAAWIVFRFMVRLMNAESSHLKDEDYRHEGLVGTVTIAHPRTRHRRNHLPAEWRASQRRRAFSRWQAAGKGSGSGH